MKDRKIVWERYIRKIKRIHFLEKTIIKLNQDERLGEQISSSILETPFLLFIFFRYYWIFSLCIIFLFLSSVLLHWCKDHSILSPIASHHDLLNFVSVRIIISLSTLMYEFVRCTMTNRITRSSDQIIT